MTRRPLAPIVLSEQSLPIISDVEPIQPTPEFAPEHKDYFRTHIVPIIKNRSFGEALEAAEIIGGVWLGDARDAMDTTTLSENNIDCVVNCAEKATLTCAEYYPTGWNYLGLQCDDTSNYDILGNHLDEFTAFMDKCVGEKKKVLVHCAAGINRSATLLIAYLVQRRGMCLKDAISLCFKKRPIILTNEAFVLSLIERFV